MITLKDHGFTEIPKAISFYKFLKEEDNLRQKIKNEKVIFSSSGLRYVKVIEHKGYKCKISVFEDCQISEENDNIVLKWNENGHYKISMKPFSFTQSIADFVTNHDKNYYFTEFLFAYYDPLFTYNEECIEGYEQLLSEIQNCQKHMEFSASYILQDDLEVMISDISELIKLNYGD